MSASTQTQRERLPSAFQHLQASHIFSRQAANHRAASESSGVTKATPVHNQVHKHQHTQLVLGISCHVCARVSPPQYIRLTHHSSYVLTSQRVSDNSVHGLCLEIPFLSRILTQSLRNAPKQRDVEREQMKKSFLSCVGFSVGHASHYFHPFFHYPSLFFLFFYITVSNGSIHHYKHCEKDNNKIPIIHHANTILRISDTA